MNLRSLLQDILSGVSPKVIIFQIELISWVGSSDYFKVKKTLRTCIMASQSTGILKNKITNALWVWGVLKVFVS